MNTLIKFGVLLFATAFASAGMAQDMIIPLWGENIPNSKKSSETETQDKGNILWIQKVQEPTLAVFLPTPVNNSGRAVIICPGGGYGGLAYDWEGTDFAKWFNSKGITAIVLKYRLPGSASVVVNHQAPLQDARRAVQLVRKNAKEWGLDSSKIGIMGFSAGGHLASTLSTHYDLATAPLRDEADSLSARPDFSILIYPVITLDSLVSHGGSRRNLVGENPSPTLVYAYSNELHVNSNTPPTLLIHASDDDAVPVENSILYYQALIKAGVQTEMHLYPTGGHGFGLALRKGHLQTWPDRMYEWIQSLN